MNIIKKLDYFRKYTSDNQTQTSTGACFSLFAIFLVLFFMAVEFSDFLTPTLNKEVVVLSNASPVNMTDMEIEKHNKVKINIDLTLFKAPCEGNISKI